MSTQTPPAPTPPGFRGWRPDLPITMYRRNLPHWRQAGATYFVTFRTADALPGSKLQELRLWKEQWINTNGEKGDWEAFCKGYMALADQFLDEGCGECIFQYMAPASLLGEILLHFQGERYRVFAYVVMPNHCHVAIQPFGDWELDQLLESWKGYASRKVNQVLGRKGKLWQD